MYIIFEYARANEFAPCRDVARNVSTITKEKYEFLFMIHFVEYQIYYVENQIESSFIISYFCFCIKVVNPRCAFMFV